MNEVCGNIKTLLADMQGKCLSNTAKLVAILEQCGITDKDEVAALLEIGQSTLRTARAALKNERSKTSSARNQALENERSARNQAKTLENERSKSSAPSRAHATKESPTEISYSKVKQQQQLHAADVVDAKRFSEQLFEAGGEALSDIAVGLHIIAEPIGWVQGGADIELDILPAIAAVAKRRPSRSISSWSYFRQAVSNAKDARLRGLPEPQAPNVVTFRQTDTSGRPLPTAAEVMAKIRAEEAAYAAG